MLLYSTHTVVSLCKPPFLTHRSFCKFRYTEPRHRSGPLNQRSSRTRGRGREIFFFEGETRSEAIHSYTPSSYLLWSKPQSARVGFQNKWKRPTQAGRDKTPNFIEPRVVLTTHRQEPQPTPTQEGDRRRGWSYSRMNHTRKSDTGATPVRFINNHNINEYYTIRNMTPTVDIWQRHIT